LEGSSDSQDIHAARAVAGALDLHLTEVIFTVEEGLAALPEVVRHLETYDVPTVRAAVPLYLLAKHARQVLGLKVMMVGEGSDELFAGYHRFEGLDPTGTHRECCRLVDGLYQSELLRVDRATMAWGIEARVPFMDAQVVDAAMRIAPELKMRSNFGAMEKFVLRSAFCDIGLPEEILWRKKMQVKCDPYYL
jgi:asparagine synthase (glutamine-hydrolysing)